MEELKSAELLTNDGNAGGKHHVDLSGATLILVASRMMMSASLPGVSEPVLPSSRRAFAPFMVPKRSTSRVVSSGGVPGAGVGHWSGGAKVPCSRIIWFTTMRCMFMQERIWVKK